jgi:hypothetical protein
MDVQLPMPGSSHLQLFTVLVIEKIPHSAGFIPQMVELSFFGLKNLRISTSLLRSSANDANVAR